MTKEEFIAKVMRRFPQLDDCESKSCFISDIGEKYSQGWEYADVVAYVKHFEEVTPAKEDPEMTAEDVLRDEARVFEIWARLESKYLHTCKPEEIRWDFKSLSALI
jgi:hypothetical protein